MSKLPKIILVGSILIALPLVAYLAAGLGKTDYRARAGEGKEAFVFLTPTRVEVERGEIFSLSVKLDTGRQVVGGAEIKVDFDLDLLALTGEIENGPAFENLEAEVEAGQVSFHGEGELIGQTTIATFHCRGLKRGETTVNLSGSSIIWDKQISLNLLGQTAGAQVVIK